MNVDESQAYLRREVLGDRSVPRVGIILGSGLGGLADKISEPLRVSYDRIPGFVRSTAGGHAGQLIFGRLETVSVVAMAGRFHRYEGWTNDQTAFPVQVMHQLGAKTLIVSNAAGGVSPKLRVGDIVVIADHLNFMNGTFGFDRDSARLHPRVLGSRRRGRLYDAELARVALAAAASAGGTAVLGNYLATLGPTYETRAEYRMMRRLGADVVGMSTVPEVLMACHLGMKVLGLSMVSNVADPDRPIVADHSEVLEAGRAVEVKMEAVVRAAIRASIQ